MEFNLAIKFFTMIVAFISSVFFFSLYKIEKEDFELRWTYFYLSLLNIIIMITMGVI